MRISSTYFAQNFLTEANGLEQKQNQLQNQASTGLKLSLPEDNPSVMADVLNLQNSSSQNTQYQTNISNLQTAATTTSNSMNSLQTIVNRVNEIATLATSGTTSPTQLASYSTEVGNLLQQAVQIGNTQDANGNYIFAGTDNSSPPFTATTDANKNITAVTYNGNASNASTEVAPNVTVSAQTPGANTTGTGPRGLFTDSRYGADLFNHMISLQQNLASGNTAAITSTDAPALQNDESNLVYQISANGVTQSTLTNATNISSSQSTNITQAISNDTNADMATTLLQLSQTQVAYQAALASSAQVMNLSLLNYLQ